MRAHIVLAHPEPKSFNGHLAGVARHALEDRGWSVTLSDLYAMGFDPCERAEHYADRQNTDRFDVQAEQRNASDRGKIPSEVTAEIARLDAADLVVLQYPMWWHLPPAMLKGWFDRVLIYGEVYTSGKRFEAGRFAGKRAMVSVSVATSAETYAFDGRSGDISLLLWPVNFTLAYVGFTVLEPFVAYGVESGLRYSGADEIATRLKTIEADLTTRIAGLESVPAISFNTMSEWGTNGRIEPGAPAHSPFVRHRERLDLD
ncbi:MAG: NAD(P)H-dependent oxidoreductase [Alphaproteobacteria bacterium]